MIRNEFAKLFAQRILPILCIVLIVANGMFFFNHTLSYQKIRDAYKLSPTMVQKDFFGNIASDDLYKSEAYERIRQTKTYATWLNSYILDMQMKVNSGLFGDENSVVIQELEMGIQTYQNLRHIHPRSLFQGGLEALFSYHLTVLFASLIGFATCFFLFFQEKKDGMHSYFLTTKKFYSLFYIKLFTCLLVTLFSFLIMTVLQWIIAFVFVGGIHLFEPIQGVYGMYTVPFAWNAGIYSLVCFLWQIGVLCMIVCGMIVLVNLFLSVLGVCFSIFVITLLQYFLKNASLIQFHSVSIFRLFDGVTVLNHAFRVPVFHFLVPQYVYMIVWIFVMSICSLFFGRKYYHHIFSHRTLLRKHHSFFISKSLFGMEWSKLWLHSSFLVVLCFVICFECLHLNHSKQFLSAYQYTYRNYSSVLEGEKSQTKDDFLLQEESRLSSMASENVSVQMDAFYRAKEKYHLLHVNDVYVYDDGYQYWFRYAMQYLIVSFGMLIISLIVVFSKYLTLDHECHVDVLVRMHGKENTVFRMQLLFASIVSVVFACIGYFPYFVYINRLYGFPSLLASAKYVGLGWDVPLVLLFIFQFLVLSGLIFSVFFVVKWLHKYVSRYVHVLLVCLVIYVLVFTMLFQFIHV